VADLPTFLIIGARKAGTTSLFSYLEPHPEVFMPPGKEIHFFSEHNWARGLDWYRSQFSASRGAKAIGEASPGYTQYPLFKDVPERIARVLPDVRLVYVVRHPVDRLVSTYRQDVHSWGERRPIDEAVLDVERHLSGSMYALQIERYLAHFSREQLLVITSDELRTRRVETLRRLYAFLGVDPSWAPPSIGRELNRGEDLRHERALTEGFRRTGAYRLGRRLVPPSLRRAIWRAVGSRPADIPLGALELSDDTRRQVVELLRPDLERLRTYLGDDFDAWGLLDASPDRA
jgi:sulfotransferase family protein